MLGSVRKLKIRWKLLTITLPLMVLPLVFVGAITGYVAHEQAQLGVVEAARIDLEHTAQFTLDLLASHHRQFQVYKEDKRQTIIRDLSTLAEFAYNVAATQHRRQVSGLLDEATARADARAALKAVNIGETGYVYVLNSAGDLRVHVASEGANIRDARDEQGRSFIQEMIEKATKGPPGEVHTIVYPWRNELLGESQRREKVVAYKYFEPWDWIVAAGSYLNESYEDVKFERRAFESLIETIGSKRIGDTGYIYAMTSRGELTIHPFERGSSVWDERDDNGETFIRTMCRQKQGWIRYPWKNRGEPERRMKLVHYRYFEPWDWIVAVGSYEEEFYRHARAIGMRILAGVGMLTLIVALIAVVLAFLVSKFLTDPIRAITYAMREVRRGRLDTRLEVVSDDELGELARDFNTMTDVLRENRELEASLAKQERMASLGVLSSEVAHEINNPLGVILGYASLIEGKLEPDDPNLERVREIKNETRRCKDIVQDLLSYTRVPTPSCVWTDVNALLDQVLGFTSNHQDLRELTIDRRLAADLPQVRLDPDQIRRVVINLLLNAGAAMEAGGRISVRTHTRREGGIAIAVHDEGFGIAPENLARIFEPFFSTRAEGTGLGLAISKTIVEQHGGSIHVESTRGQGTTVTIHLPLSPEVPR